MSEEVEEGEEDAEGFLHAQEAVEGPFAVVLEDGVYVRWVACEAGVGGYVLACVIAFGWAGPEEKSAVECCLWSELGRLKDVRM
jgi:hypothetical protein